MFDDIPIPWWFIVPLVQVLWVVAVTIWILFERRSPLSTIAWILGLSFLPLVGVPIYLLLGPRRFDRKKLRHAAAQDAACRLGPNGEELLLDKAPLPSRALMVLAHNAAGPSATPRRAEPELYVSGEHAYAALERDIAAAEHHVHLEYYIWQPDRAGTRLRDLLAKKARNNVKIRVLIDGFGSSAASDAFWLPLRNAGGRVQRFNALSIARWRPRLANFRTHRKIAVIDGAVGFTGGMNISEVHSAEFAGQLAWRDTHLRLAGPAVHGLQMVFFEGWHYATGHAPAEEHCFPPLERAAGTAPPVQVVASGPDENCNAIHKMTVGAIAAARERVLLTTAYFVPDEPLRTALASAALRGVDVQLMVPTRSDLRVVGAASRSYYPDLLAMGVKVFEYGPAMLHAKTLVVDDTVALVGTANADPRSFFLNFEVSVACYQPEACDQLAACFADDLRSAAEVTTATIARTGFGQKLFQNAARLLSPIL